MIFIGIDVAKDKHNCCILSSNGSFLCQPFTITNNIEGFETLYAKIISCNDPEIKVGLEATGHYSYNILGFLLRKSLTTFVLNPLHVNLFRKSLTLRKTKTDTVDSRAIATLLASEPNLKPFTLTSYHNAELKSLTRYRFDKVRDRAKLKQSVSRLVNILFPELEDIFPTLHLKSVYAMLKEFPGAISLKDANIEKLENVLKKVSRGHYNQDKALATKELAKVSIGSDMPAKAMELKHTICLIEVLDDEINEIEERIKTIMDEIKSPILTVPGISYRMGAMIIAEIGDFSQFASPDKILAFAGMSPSTYQSGKQTSSHAKMEKRGSKYLRYALHNATKYACLWCPVLSKYHQKKIAEGKHYYVAMSHATKKLVRILFHLVIAREAYSAV